MWMHLYIEIKYIPKHCNSGTFSELDGTLHDDMHQSILHWGIKIAYYNVGKGSYTTLCKECSSGSIAIAKASAPACPPVHGVHVVLDPANLAKAPHILGSWIINVSLVPSYIRCLYEDQGRECTHSLWFGLAKNGKGGATICESGFGKNTKPAIGPQHQHPSWMWCIPNALEMSGFPLEWLRFFLEQWQNL